MSALNDKELVKIWTEIVVELEALVDHKAYHCQEEVIIKPEDFDEIPKKIKFSIHHYQCLDGVERKILRPPRQYLNIWVQLEYGKPVPLLFDLEGHPYIMAPAKHQETAPLLNAIVAGLKDTVPIKIQVYIREERAEEILERLEKATDFCDICAKPLNESEDSWLEHDAESIADVYVCPFCEMESIRWDKDFIEWHPRLQEMADAAHMELKTR